MNPNTVTVIRAVTLTMAVATVATMFWLAAGIGAMTDRVVNSGAPGTPVAVEVLR
jgi:hypothetical protein